MPEKFPVADEIPQAGKHRHQHDSTEIGDPDVPEPYAEPLRAVKVKLPDPRRSRDRQHHHLKRRLQLPPPVRRNHHLLLRRQRPQARHHEFPTEHRHRDPRGHQPVLHRDQHRRRYEDLVRQRIHQRAEIGDLIPAPRQMPVQQVGRPRQNRQNVRPQSQRKDAALRKIVVVRQCRQHHENHHHDNAADGQDIRQIFTHVLFPLCVCGPVPQ